MRVALFLLTLAVVALIVALTLAVVRWRRQVKVRRAARLDHFKIVLREVDVAVDRWDPADAVGTDLVNKIRDELIAYYHVSNNSVRRKLNAAEYAWSQICQHIWRTPMFMLPADDKAGHEFLRTAGEALRRPEPKETT